MSTQDQFPKSMVLHFSPSVYQKIEAADMLQNVTVAYICDLPYEVPSNDVVDFFSSYGEVLTIECSVAANFPNLCA